MIDVKGLLFASGRRYGIRFKELGDQRLESISAFLSSDETERTDLIEISGINGRNNSGQRSGTLP